MRKYATISLFHSFAKSACKFVLGFATAEVFVELTIIIYQFHSTFYSNSCKYAFK